MKTILPILLIVLVVGGIVFFDKNKSERPSNEAPIIEGEELSNETDGIFNFDTDNSTAKWTGSRKIIKDYFDTGSINIKSGFVTINNGEVTSGEVVFDMTSIYGESTSNERNPVTRLTEHLKSEDFFEVENFPEAKYVVNKAEQVNGNINLIGELTLKGQTHPLNVPVTIKKDGENVLMSGIVEVDRTIWNVRYGSDKFFDNMGDNVINDTFVLEFVITANQ